MDHYEMRAAMNRALEHSTTNETLKSTNFTSVYHAVLESLNEDYINFEDRKRAADDITHGLWTLCVMTQQRLSLDESMIEKIFAELAEKLLCYVR